MTGRAAPLRAGALLAVLGVVFGDIGTSPLYALKVSLQHMAPGGVREAEVLGILSLIVWSLITVVTVKYVALVMRADNNGEGGVLALMALALRRVETPRHRAILGAIGIGGACLFFGDGAITPAISVLSAVEGLQTVYPEFERWVLPISIVVILGLFAVQTFGTARIGRVFGPVMLAWFATLGVLGVLQIAQDPGILAALSPHHGARFSGTRNIRSISLNGAISPRPVPPRPTSATRDATSQPVRAAARDAIQSRGAEA